MFSPARFTVGDACARHALDDACDFTRRRRAPPLSVHFFTPRGASEDDDGRHGDGKTDGTRASRRARRSTTSDDDDDDDDDARGRDRETDDDEDRRERWWWRL